MPIVFGMEVAWVEKGWRTVRYLRVSCEIKVIAGWMIGIVYSMNVCTDLSRAIAVNVNVDMYTEIHYKDDECIIFHSSGRQRFQYLISFQMKVTWLEGKSLHKGSPRTQRPINVDSGVRGTDTEIF